jgi:predicted  nucleic acid-binding Zn-ribbon protein
MMIKGCKRCGGDLFEEPDLDSPALMDVVCFQCGNRTSTTIPVYHVPARREEERPQVVEAQARANSIANLRLVQHVSREVVALQMGVSHSTIDRAQRRAAH